MRKESLALVHPGLVPFLAVTFLALPLQSCLQTTSVDCGPHFACPAGMKCAANQNVCIVDDCGDGTLQPGEACDDGNLLDTDGCSANCLSTEVCGNGITDEAIGEFCDDGTNNGESNKCNLECKAVVGCGNGEVEPGEVCDEGRADTATCDNDCTPPSCGDGHLNEAASEVCDPRFNTACNLNCTPSVCGDGIVNPRAGEDCDSGQLDDSGNAKETRLCNTNCTFSRCGDKIVNNAAGEVCDPGATPQCNSTCTSITRCGDGVVDYWRGEKCDDGNEDNCGSCNEDCSQGQGMNRANGMIIALSPDNIKDKDLLSFELPATDDESNKITFEFDEDGAMASSKHIKINIKDLSESHEIAQKIFNAINNKTSESGVSATYNWRSNTVNLQHIYMGKIGNGPRITKDSDGLYVTGMKDGAGVGCAAGVACKANWDCKSGVCDSGTCE